MASQHRVIVEQKETDKIWAKRMKKMPGKGRRSMRPIKLGLMREERTNEDSSQCLGFFLGIGAASDKIFHGLLGEASTPADESDTRHDDKE